LRRHRKIGLQSASRGIIDANGGFGRRALIGFLDEILDLVKPGKSVQDSVLPELPSYPGSLASMMSLCASSVRVYSNQRSSGETDIPPPGVGRSDKMNRRLEEWAAKS